MFIPLARSVESVESKGRLWQITKLFSPLLKLWFVQVCRFCLALFLMEDSGFTEKLDSLWFFSNVLSLRSQSMASATDEKATQISLHHSPKSEATKPLSIIAQNQKNQTENAEVLVQQRRCLNCGEFAVETEGQIAKTEVLEVLPPVKEEKRRSKRSFKSCLNQRRRVLGESDLQVKGLGDMGFDVNVVCGNWVVEEASGYQWFGSPHHVKMPPLSDGMAMKHHLKSWAYAVACTVR